MLTCRSEHSLTRLTSTKRSFLIMATIFALMLSSSSKSLTRMLAKGTRTASLELSALRVDDEAESLESAEVSAVVRLPMGPRAMMSPAAFNSLVQ